MTAQDDEHRSGGSAADRCFAMGEQRSACRQSECESGARGHYGCLPGVDGRDDLLDIDSLQVDAGRPEVRMPKLPLDDVQRHALAGELDRVRVAELVRRETSPHSSPGRERAELAANRGAWPRPTAGRSVDHAEQRSDGKPGAVIAPRTELLPGPIVQSDLATPTTLFPVGLRSIRGAGRDRSRPARVLPVYEAHHATSPR